VVFYIDCTDKRPIVNLPDSVLPTVLTSIPSLGYPVPFHRLDLLIFYPEGIRFVSAECSNLPSGR